MLSQEPRLERAGLHRRFVAAAAEEHRLHQQAAKERLAAERWRQRAAFAEDKGLSQLAAQALERVEGHERRAELLGSEYQQRRRLVEQLRDAVRHPELVLEARHRHLLVPAAEAGVEQQLNELEREALLEQDLAELKQRVHVRRAGSTREPAG